MDERSRLGNLILEHWKAHRPRMVAQLERESRLREAVQVAEDRAADLLYEFLNVRRMQYQDAWELAMRECLLPEEPSSPRTSPSGPPATSA